MDMSIEFKKKLTAELEIFKSLSLKEKKKFASEKAKLYKAYDSSIKTILNSCYGALAEKNFHFYDPDVAESITVTGQYMVRNLGETFKALLEKNYGPGIYLLNQDTDSVPFDTKIRVGGIEVSIGEFYEKSLGFDMQYAKGKSVKLVSDVGYKTLSVNDRFELQEKKITYVMKHKVKKKQYRISVAGREVIVTEDHSVMVRRDGKLIEVKPGSIKRTDEFITNFPDL